MDCIRGNTPAATPTPWASGGTVTGRSSHRRFQIHNTPVVRQAESRRYRVGQVAPEVHIQEINRVHDEVAFSLAESIRVVPTSPSSDWIRTYLERHRYTFTNPLQT